MTGVWDQLRNARVVRAATEYSTLIPDYFRARRGPGGDDGSFDCVHTFVLFLGIGRSGSTLVGSLLDAHPNIVIARQQNVFKYLYPLSFKREQMFWLLLRNARCQAGLGNPGGGGYRYSVPGQSQGRSARIEVIGDKSRSAQAVEWLSFKPDLMEALSRVVQARVRLLHVVRNPFDVIARRSLRRGVALNRISKEYFALTRQMQGLFARIEADRSLNAERIVVHLEDLIRTPKDQLQRICDGLDVPASPSYLEACSGIVYPTPGLARHEVQWPEPLLEQIALEIAQVPWLSPYRFEDHSQRLPAVK